MENGWLQDDDYEMVDRELLDPRRSWLGFLATSGLLLLMLFLLLDPAPSQGLGPQAKIAFWILHIYTPLALAQICQLILARYSLIFGNIWASVAIAGITASTLFAPMALILDGVFGLHNLQQEKFALADLRDEWISFAPPVTLVWIGLNAARFLKLPVDLQPSSPEVKSDPSSLNFMNRLPAHRRGQLIAVSAELHYLRVYTTLGDTLILQGFGEALSEIGEGSGLQIHRSHWINPDFVVELINEFGRTDVKLLNGIVLPVARSRRSEVRAKLQMKAPSPQP